MSEFFSKEAFASRDAEFEPTGFFMLVRVCAMNIRNAVCWLRRLRAIQGRELQYRSIRNG